MARPPLGRTERLAELVAELVRRRAIDRGRAVGFGSPLPSSAVGDFEARHGVALPSGYARFLTEIGDGGWSTPDGRLLTLDEAERRSAVGELAEEFTPSRDLLRTVPSRPPGLLWITEGGCSYGTGIVLAGPERGNVWEYVEVTPGWIPVSPCQTFRDEQGAHTPCDDVFDHYERALRPDNADLRVTFDDWLLAWLEDVSSRT